MLEIVAICSGAASFLVAMIAVISMYLTKKHILDILDKDKILFDSNFGIKKSSICNALAIIDEIQTKGTQIRNDVNFVLRAKHGYNELMCVLTHITVADEFLSIVLDADPSTLDDRIKIFKLACRYDVGLDTKRKQSAKKQAPEKENIPQQTASIFAQPTQPQVQAVPVQEPIASMPAQEIRTEVQPQAQVARPQQPVRPKMPQNNQAQVVRQPVRPQGQNPAQQSRVVPGQATQMRPPVQQPRPVDNPRNNN